MNSAVVSARRGVMIRSILCRKKDEILKQLEFLGGHYNVRWIIGNV